MARTKSSLLVVDDEFSVRDSLTHWFRKDGHHVDSAEHAAEALRRLENHSYDVVLLDIKMPGMDGIALQERIHKLNPEIAVIMITAFATIETAVQTLKQGAFDYVTKPIDPDELSHLVRRALDQKRLRAENAQLRETIVELSTVGTIIGESPRMLEMLELVRIVAQSDATVLVQGESGTGKELIARAVHANSQRRYFPIVPVSCGALSDGLLESDLFGHEKGAFTGAQYRRKGKLEMADGGTLFLDEIGTIGQKMQVDLLRVLETKEFTRLGGSQTVRVDFRVVCATNENLEDAIREGRFREDLYYRLNVFKIVAPPLRQRGGDIALLARHFLRLFAVKMGKRITEIDAAALKLLRAHEWPGNVRELANAIERAVVVGKPPAICAADFSLISPRNGDDAEDGTLAGMERRHIARILEKTSGNITHAAQILAIDRTTLYNKIKKYALRK